MYIMARLFPLVIGAMLFNASSAGASAGSASQVPPRDQIPAESQWHLTDIYANEGAWQADFDKLRGYLPLMSSYKGKLAEPPHNLAECLELRDKIGVIGGKLYAYARLHRDENAAVTKYQALTGKMESLLTEAGTASAFIEPEILAMPDADLAKIRKNDPALNEYSFYFDNLERQKKHVLSPAEEELLSLSGEATQTPENVFNMLSHADMTFPDVTDAKGNKLALSEGLYHSYIMSPDRTLREQSFKALFGTYNSYRNTFAATLNGSVKKNIFYARARKYDSVLGSSLAGDNISPEVYDNLITTVDNNLGPLQRYVALKKKVLGLSNIHMYDLYTPLVPSATMKFEYPEGLKLIHSALAPLGPEYALILDKGLSSGWVDVYENKGKQTGAYSWGVYSVHPYVLLNFHGQYDDVSTVAHEMGHAIHSYYSFSNQPYINSNYATFAAEVASTTNEVLLIDYMLKTTTDKQQKLFLLNQYLENIRGTVYRQTMFAEFEKMIYAKSEQGETLTADSLDAMWHDLNVKYYGPNITIDKEIDVEWARIPHFYWDFYVYQYVTGYSAATALADQLQTQGLPSQERYLGFLKSGGSDYPINILKKAGVDMSSPAPIEVTLKKFSSLLDQLESLLKQQ